MKGQDFITFNVGGQIFITKVSTIRRHPQSRFAHMLDETDPEFKVVNSQVFIDRDWGLFRFIMEYLRTGRITLSGEFETDGLLREAEFYNISALSDFLRSNNCYAKSEILELRFVIQDAQSFFKVFSSKSTTLDALASRISVFIEQPKNLTQNLMEPLPVRRPSHHDLVFQCGADCSDGKQLSARYVTIEPDERKLLNATNVLGLLVDTILRDGFHLISTRTVSPEEKIECYTFERRETQNILINDLCKADGSHVSKQTEKSTKNGKSQK
ncbi:putative potassium channel regulatory protein [Tachysurus fulvidraco]|uniref:putative potassium channel regulatory protein n=1 Tax=Tachysurus fulvidraco TaxID=1234273 RepID=UPI000F514B35|nr:putative potassium channel regulatory protein [Tachysurus fulvidraco]XP_047659099.1 putative potassium channel regulatory protein [Tachysurus fulvidraco]XP_047659100.1 putative potassium channel regulatory protein [Tachysurus fulvidraco]